MSISIKQQFHKEMCSVKKCDICADFYFCYSNWLEAHLETHTLPKDKVYEVVEKEIKNMADCDNVEFPKELNLTEKAVKQMANICKVRAEYLLQSLKQLESKGE